jgi:hypothetical protein
MASVDAVTVGPAPVAAGRAPVARSWVDRVGIALERAPGPTWLAYLGLIAVFVVGSTLDPALRGVTDPAAYASQAFWGVALPLTLWLLRHLGSVAASAFDTFRPLLAMTEDAVARLRREVVVTPARPAAAMLIVSAVVTPLYYVADPAASGIVGVSPVGIVLRWVSETLFGGLLFVLLYQSVRQLRAVGRLHEAAVSIDLFRPAPLYAFSQLTSRAAIIIALVFTVPTFVAAGQTSLAGSWLLVVAPWTVTGIAASLAVFILPLRGMQRRLIAEKRRLQGEVGGRIEATIGALHAAVDRGDMGAAAGMNDVLGALVVERDLVNHLPTLPWRAGTLGAVVSSIVIPLGLFVVTRLIERLL